MAIYRRFIVQQKYVDGQPTEEFRLGMEVDGKNYHSQEACESGSECLKLEYQWVDVEGEYICEDTTKYTKQKRQQKCIEENEWVDIYPYEYQKGDVIEEDSRDCGGIHYLYTDTDGNGEISYSPIKSEYTGKDTVTFRTTPNEGYLFSCYNIGSTSSYGDIVESSVMSLSMHNDWYVKALFKPQMFSLYTSVISGIGMLSVFPSSSQYSYGERVFITAIPNESYLFNGFVYDSNSSYRRLSTNDNPMYVDMVTDYWVDVNFKPNPEYFNCLEWGYTNGDVFISCEPVSVSLTWAYLARWAYNATDYKYKNTLKYVKDKDGQVTNLGDCGFSECGSLESVYLPEVSYIPISCFYWNKSLTNISIPKAERIYHDAFYYCGFSSISLPNVSSFVYNSVYPDMFGGNGVLSDIYLAYSSIVNNFDLTRFYVNCNSNLLIHVPDSLVSAYIESCLGVNVNLSGLTKPLSECIVGLDTLYRVNTYSTQYCDIIVEPSKSLYSYGETVTITAIPTEGFSLDYFMYGSDTNFIESEMNKQFVLSMTNSWYIQPSASPITGGLYLLYSNGTEKLIDFNSSILSSGDFNNVGGRVGLTNVYDYGNTVTSVETGIFSDIITLSSVSFPSLINIGSYAFYNTRLNTVDFPNVVEVNNYAFRSISTLSVVNLPICKSIGMYVFYDTNLNVINLEKCEYVGSYAFNSCSNLVSINLHNVSETGEGAFYACTKLTNVNLPNLKWVNSGVFYACRSLVSIDLPNATEIGNGCFMSCNELTTVNCQNMKYISYSAFYGLSKLENINLEKVSFIGEAAFCNVPNLKNGNMLSLEIVNRNTFSGCTELINVDLPVCTTISSGGFRNCTKLNSINIPVCTTIGSSAFMNCTNLETMRLDNVTTVPTVSGRYALYGTNLTSIYVPSSLYSDFLKAAYWSSFASSKFIPV